MKKSAYLLLSIVVLIFAGCSKDDKEETPAPTNPGGNSGAITISSPWQYSVKIDGTTFANVEGTANFQGSFSWNAGLQTFPDSSYTTFSSGLNDNNSINKSLSVTVGRIHFMGNQVDTAAFKAYIHSGAYSYSAGSFNGVSINWVDANGGLWNTGYGTADQTGSAFTITDIQYLGLVLSNYEIKFKATFNCKLHNLTTASTMTLTDGIYVGKFENYN